MALDRVGNLSSEQFVREISPAVGGELSGTFQPLDATLTDLAGRNIGAALATDILDRAAGDGRYALTSTIYSDEAAQDAVGAMVDGTLVYVDGTPLLTRAALTGDVSAAQGSNTVTVTKINGVALSGLATGILKNTTGTGVPSIAVAADFPTLNQNTTGSAAKLTTPRTIAVSGKATGTGTSFDGSGNISIPITAVTLVAGDIPTIAQSQVTLANDLAALEALSGSNVFPLRTGVDTWTTVTFDLDGTFAANSDTRLPSQKAIKTYVDTAVTGLLDFKGSTDCSANPNYPASSKGDAYIVSVAGKIGGASGTSVEVGDVYVASADNAGGTQAAVGTSWFTLEHNLVGAALTANNLSDLANAATARTNLGLGTAATQNTGTSGATVPVLNGAAATWANGAAFGGRLDVTSMFVNGVSLPTSGAGVASIYSAGVGLISAFSDLALGTRAPLRLAGSQVDLQPGGSTVVSVSSTGAVVTGVCNSTGDQLISGTGAQGYTTGSGGAVTQATSKSTGVTLNRTNGGITMNAAALAASTSVAFTLTNSTIAATDVVNVSIKSGATSLAYLIAVQATAAGSCSIVLRNVSAGSLSEAVVLNFAVLKAVTG